MCEHQKSTRGLRFISKPLLFTVVQQPKCCLTCICAVVSVVCVFICISILVVAKAAELNAMTRDRLPPIQFISEEAEYFQAITLHIVI